MHYECKKVAGIDVLLAPMQDSNSITVEVLVKAGSLYETQQSNGLSHFLEHMFFKGGKKYTSAKEVTEAIDAIGGDYNAFTSYEYAGYYVKSAPEHVFLSLDVLSDMLVHAAFPVEEIEKEKGVIIQEIKMYEDRPERKVQKLRGRNYYGDNCYGRDILGPEQNVLSFSQQDFFNHKQNLYTKDNLIIIVAGKITDSIGIEHAIANLFNMLPEKSNLIIPQYSPIHPLGKRDTINQGTHQNHLVLGGEGYSGSDDNRYAARLLSTILGGTMSSRLFQEIREKRGLCYYISAGHSTSPDHGKFMIRAGLSKENYTEGVDAINKELTNIATGNITIQELEKGKGNKIGSLQMGIETSDDMADFLGFQQLIYGEVITLEQTKEEFTKVTLEQINTIANILHPEKLYGCIID